MPVGLDPLTIGSMTTRLKRIRHGTVLRIIINVHLTALPTDEEEVRATAYIDAFYAHVRATNMRFATVIVLSAIDASPDTARRLLERVCAHRETTKAFSVATVIVANPMIALLGECFLKVYGAQSTVHFVEQLDDAKRICRDVKF